MSSARNHAKRSHRSEHFKQSTLGHSERKAIIRSAQKPKRTNFFKAIADRLRKNKTPTA
jgi:hypothetical protein